MSLLPSSDSLADTRQVTAILRLTVDRDGHLLHGEVVNVSDNSSMRFKNWADMTRTLRTWLARQSEAHPPDPL